MNINRKRYGFAVLCVMKFSSEAPRKFATNSATNFFQDYKSWFRKISTEEEKKTPKLGPFLCKKAGIRGFEPRLTDSKSGALPLNYIPTTILL